jgi:hypothetical protein
MEINVAADAGSKTMLKIWDSIQDCGFMSELMKAEGVTF